MSERTKLFLTILFRYAVVALLARLVNLGVFTSDQAEAFTPWLVESIVTIGVPVFIAWLAHFAAQRRLSEVEAAGTLHPDIATPENIRSLATSVRKSKTVRWWQVIKVALTVGMKVGRVKEKDRVGEIVSGIDTVIEEITKK